HVLMWLCSASRGSRSQQQLHAVARRVEQIAIGFDLGKGPDNAGEYRVRLIVRYGLLPHENLPQSDQRLERSRHIGALQRIADFVDRLDRFEELQDGLIADAA